MPSFLRFLQVIRKGPRSARFQAWGGLVLIVGAGLWLIFEYLLPLLGAVLVAFVGFVLVRRSLRDSRPSS
jgi:predicted PurR-regulated permease PerM